MTNSRRRPLCKINRISDIESWTFESLSQRLQKQACRRLDWIKSTLTNRLFYWSATLFAQWIQPWISSDILLIIIILVIQGSNNCHNSPSLFSHKFNNWRATACLLITCCSLMALWWHRSVIPCVRFQSSGDWRVLTAQLIKTLWVVHSEWANTLAWNNEKHFHS